ncbi:amidohydrolase family protein [bacterium]|nr:amidohydrolase family protein [bacterium]
MKSLLSIAVVLSLMLGGCGRSIPDFQSFPKIDCHVHIETSSPDFPELARRNGFSLVTLNTGGGDSADISSQKEFALLQASRFPKTVFWAATFRLDDRDREGWEKRTVSALEQAFSEGAIGVKIWKDIGMVFRDAAGNFLMPDDARFKPVWAAVERHRKVVYAHLGEPKNCWLPLEKMTVNNDRSYFRDHPQYHMFLHPEYPSHEALMAARDRWLERNPGLRVIGCHLGSMEWDTDSLASCLDRHPNYAVDMAARICHLQVQDREKVRAFLIRYQDRILYGTDLVVHPDTNLDWAERTWMQDWLYFTTDSLLTSDAVERPFRGLRLPDKVLKKIYRENALAWIPGLAESGDF